MLWLIKNILVEKFGVLVLELLKHIVIIQKFFDRAVLLAQEVFDGRATLVAIVLPEVTIEESKDKLVNIVTRFLTPQS